MVHGSTVQEGRRVSERDAQKRLETYVSIAEEGKEPVFFGNTYQTFEPFTVRIPEDGLYTIECSGKQASGIMTVNFSGQE